MNNQLQIPLFSPEIFASIRKEYTLQDINKLQNELEHLKHQVAGFKGYRTKRKKNKK